MNRKPAPFRVVQDTRIAIDYTTTVQFGGRAGLKDFMRACYFTIGAPGKCAHYVMNLPKEADDFQRPDELETYLLENLHAAQHIRTCHVR
jgi:hypothetical protein